MCEDKFLIDKILAERGKTHGDFEDVAALSQDLKFLLHNSHGWSHLSIVQREALDLICLKISRALNGDKNFIDVFTDIAGYASLVVNIMKKTDGSIDVKNNLVILDGNEWMDLKR